ncbi:MAG: SgcJ/EcaC family oxidoreductase [Gemmataceae bacterium]
MMSEALGTIGTNNTDDTAIRACLEQLATAWERGDADAFAAAFTEDADYIAFDGTHWKGRREIAECHRPLFQGFFKGSRLAGEWQTIRMLTSDVALIHSKGAILLAGQKKPTRGRLSVQTLVAVKRIEGWRLAAFQNTRYRPFARTLKGRVLALFGLLPTVK